MLSMCIRAFKRWNIRRKIIENTALFHNNGANPYIRAITGLELITERFNGYNTVYYKLSLKGNCTLFINDIDTLIKRLEFHSNALVISNANIPVRAISEDISRNKDMETIKWLDYYFNTLDIEEARAKLVKILAILRDKETVYLSEDDNDISYTFKKDTKHILIEIITLLEKFI